ncbi:DNA primase [Selenomonas sp. oral taxon 920]|uniref:DNA primase n=1 Tax=Selenomonas sp. oral taxon 920 TaxID=1884263 RepID=UPI0008409808|nr:DNA primase [Selenomonas sp. oral taxon 920]AOH48837.1 DNA primase [Selenomonas sp. oral taxon 920]
MRDPRMEAFVQQVRAQTDILAVVQGYVPLKRKGGRYWGCCPFHNEKTASFSVVPADGFFYCFGCHAGGDAFKFISLIEHITWFEAVKRQAEQLGIPLPAEKRDPREEARLRELDDLRKVNALARDFFHNCLTMTHYGAAGRAYLAGRGITEAAIERCGIGFAPDAWAKLSDAFRKRGIPEHLLVTAGLAVKRERGGGVYDRFRNRVIIPIADERGRIVGFGGRALEGAMPKYLNTAETPVFNKRKLLYGLDRAHRAIASEGCAIVVEGYMDAIAAWEAGVANVVATLGTSFTEGHAALLLRRAPRIVFCYDSDAAGQEATLRALAAVRGRAAEVRVLLLPDGKDPDEYVRTHGAEAFRALVATAVPVPAFRLRHVRTHMADGVEGQNAALQAMLPVLAELDAVARGAYVRQTAAELFLDEGVVADALRKFLQRGGAEPAAPADLQRPVLRQADDAVRRAGRELLAAAWHTPDLLTEILSFIPRTDFPDELIGGILGAMAEHLQAGGALDADFIAEQPTAARDELMRTLAEEGRTDASYRGALATLRRAYLTAALARHTRRAEAMMQEGKAAYIDELNEVKKIQDEISRENLNE